uniref:hypothetical protein n=1 Tax=Polynucleobacter sp. TaxID=2029855 RepID=UPI004048039B
MIDIFYVFDESELKKYIGGGFHEVVLTYDFLVIDMLKERGCHFLSIWDILDSDDVNITRLKSLNLSRKIKFNDASNYEMLYAIETYLNAKIIARKLNETSQINSFTSFTSENIKINRFDSNKLNHSLSLILKSSLNKFMRRYNIAIHEIK